MGRISYIPFDALVFTARPQDALGELGAFCGHLTVTDRIDGAQEQLVPPKAALYPPDSPEGRYWQAAQALISGFALYRTLKGTSMPAPYWKELSLELCHSDAPSGSALSGDGAPLSSYYQPDSTDPCAHGPRDRIALQYYGAAIDGERYYGCNSAMEVLHEQGHALLDLLKPSLAINSAECSPVHEAFADCWALTVALQDAAVAERLLASPRPFATSSEISRLLASHAWHQWQLCCSQDRPAEERQECLGRYAFDLEFAADGRPKHFALRDARNSQRWSQSFLGGGSAYKQARIFLGIYYSMIGHTLGERRSVEAVGQAAQTAGRILLQAMSSLSFDDLGSGWIGCVAAAVLGAIGPIPGEPLRLLVDKLCAERAVKVARPKQVPVTRGRLREFVKLETLTREIKERWRGHLRSRAGDAARTRGGEVDVEPRSSRAATSPLSDGSQVEVWNTLRPVDVSSVHQALRGVRLMVPTQTEVHLTREFLRLASDSALTTRGDTGSRAHALDEHARFAAAPPAREARADEAAARYVRELITTGALRLPGEPLPATASSPATHQIVDQSAKPTIVRTRWS